MSYKYKIIADNPLGYWDLSNVTSGSNYDITTSSNHALVSSNVIFSTPPLILNSGSVAKISSPTASIRINNAYSAFNANSLNSTYTLEFWFHFNGLFNGNGYEVNNTSSGYFNNNQLNILRAINTNTGSTISRIYYDYNSNTLRYGYPGTGNAEAYYYLKNLDVPFHIVATYQSGKINLIVNNEQGVSTMLYDKTLVNSASRLNMVQYLIDGSSINSNYSGSTDFLISNLALYNYQLTSNTIKSHLDWANYQDDPKYFSNLNSNINYFDFIVNEDNFVYYKKYNSFDLRNYSDQYKIYIDRNGVGPEQINPIKFVSTSNVANTFNSSSGTTWTASSDYLYFTDFGKYITNAFSIFLQTSSSVTASNQNLISINGVDGNNTLFLQKNPPSSSGYYLYYYNEFNQTSTLFASIVNPTSTASGRENVGISYDGSNIYLYASTSSVTQSITPFSIKSNSQLIIGKNIANKSASSTNNNTTFYANLSIFDYAAKDYSSASSSFNTNKMLFAPLTSSFTINQYSYVTYEYPLAFIDQEIGGSYINWSAPDNITAKVSYDNGSSWTDIYWNSYLVNHNNNTFQENILIKFEFNQKYNDIQPLRLNNLEFGLYNNVLPLSDFSDYVLIPNTSSSYDTHSFRNTNNKIVFRPENFGITFKADKTEFVPGYISASSTSLNNYGVDFWLRLDNLQNRFTSSVNNLAFNGNFEIKVSSQPSTASGWSNTGSVVPGGVTGNALFLRPQGSIQDCAVTNINRVLVEKGDIFYLESWVKITSGTNGTLFPVALFGYQSSSALSATNPYNALVSVNASTLTPNVWNKYTASFQVAGSSDLVWIAPWVSVRSDSTTGSVYYDNFILRKQPKFIYLLNTSSYSLYYTASNPVLQWASAAPMFVYVNGASVTRASYPLLRNEYYHIAISSSSPVTGNINLNGGVNNTGSFNANATYGHLALWNTTPSAVDIKNRYNLFISNVVATASIQDNTLFLRTNSYYDTASAYAID